PVVAPQHGTVVIAEDGTYTYVPEAGFVGVDEFVYEVCDDHTYRDGSPAEACSQAKVTVLVGYATVADLDTAVADLEAQIG
ncbi:MAG: cadherin-like domain-containing protein, partial [Acidimicrobiales bacterium]|nr:cadherin-like domain-containing protein [Acidimicrobiales bacterium]